MSDVEHGILVVDDDDDIRETLADFLRDEGYTVLTARNGLDALAILRSTDLHLCVILLDLMMPVMNGFQFLAEYRRDPALPVVAVTVITANGSLGPAERAALQVPVLTKPVPLQKLLDVVGSLC